MNYRDVSQELVGATRDGADAVSRPDISGELSIRAHVLQAKAEDLLAELVALDTGADNPDGQRAAMDVFGRALDSIGLSSTRQRGEDGRPVLRAERTAGRARRFLLLGHMDTVFARGTVAARPMTVEGDLLYGPGVADMKGGLATIWLALAVLHDLDIALAVDLDLLVNADEESGSAGSRALIESAARSADLALVFEPGRPTGAFVTRRRGHRRYRLAVEGRAAHTGVEPEAGVNAVVELAHKILRITELDAVHPHGNVTVSLASGGSAINVVPDTAEASIDVRIPDVAVLDDLHASMLDITRDAELEGATVSLHTFGERPPMEELPGCQGFIEQLRRVTAALDLPCQLTSTGGGSDAGIVTAVGTPAIDAMGAVGGRIHTVHEYLELPTLAERASVTASWLAGAY